MGRLLALLLLSVVFCVGASFSYLNAQPVTLNYLAGDLELPLGLALVAVFGATLVLSLCAAWLHALTQRSEIRRLRRKLESAESELNNLRNLPVREG